MMALRDRLTLAQADNPVGAQTPLCNDWPPGARLSIMARRLRPSISEAGYTTAPRLVRRHRDHLPKPEESI